MKLTHRKQVVLWSGLAGLGLLALGLWAHKKERALLGGPLGRGAFKQAPIIGSYSDGNMKTTLRASKNMPIEERIATIQSLVEKSVQDPEMRKLALQLTARCPERDQVCEAEAIYTAIKQRIRYTGDVGPIIHSNGEIEGIDLYQSARRTWQDMRGGDCDDQAILSSTLLALNGIEPILRVVKQRKEPDFSHIFTMARVRGKLHAVDTTLPGSRNFGVEGPYATARDFPA